MSSVAPELRPSPGRFCPICGAQLDAETCPTDGVPTVRADFDTHDDLALGRVIAGRFRVERFIGQGGTGRVYVATQLSIGREVALKLLQPHHVRDRKQVRRFYREARAATKLTSAHVVRVHDFGVDDDTKTPFIAMELLRGETLASMLEREGPLWPAAAARLGAQIARALAEAGDVGIVHRDLKPSNIVIVDAGDGTGIAKVADFGVAKDLVREDTEPLTQQGAAIGTPAYMAPEQVSGAPVSAQTDLYALGCILYELVSMRRPFGGEASAALLVDHLLRPAPPLPDPLPSGAPLPPALAELLAQLLAKAPSDRPQSARGGALTLAGIAGAGPAPAAPRHAHARVEERPGPGPGTQTDGDGPEVGAAPTRAAEPLLRPPRALSRLVLWLSSSAVALVVAGVVYALLSHRSDGVSDAPLAHGDPMVAALAPLAALQASPVAGLPPVPLDIDELTVRGGAARIQLHEGEPQVLVVEGDPSRITGQLQDSQLTLSIGNDSAGRTDRTDRGDRDPRRGSGAPLVVHVWSRAWSKVKIAGSATLVSEGVLEVDGLSLALSGSARAALDVRGSDLTLSLRGSADVTLRGTLESMDARIGGASRLEASALEADAVSLACSGTSEATVFPVSSLDVRNDGTGEITYFGHPLELTQDGDGIVRREAR
ncbi:MAG: protein kinase [Myxococcota bacterium]